MRRKRFRSDHEHTIRISEPSFHPAIRPCHPGGLALSRWRKPELGLHDFQGSKANNIVMASGKTGDLNVDAGHPAVFKYENPAAPADARYKALVRSSNPNGLIPMKSPDGIHWLNPLQPGAGGCGNGTG